MKKTFSYIAAGLIFGLTATVAQSASSPWFKTEGAKLRLIALPSADGKTLDAGLQIELEKGWKTYWRSPGASGLPPQISFIGSQNLASATIDFPVPMTFGSDANLTAGYDKSITFPIKVEPLFANRSTTIKSQGLIGLCEEICVPVQFQLELTTDGRGVSSRDVASALFQARSSAMSAPRADFQIVDVVVATEPERKLMVEAKLPEGSTTATLMVEGPSNWYLTPVHAQEVSDQMARFELPLRDIPKDADVAATQLTFSVITNGTGMSETRTPNR